MKNLMLYIANLELEAEIYLRQLEETLKMSEAKNVPNTPRQPQQQLPSPTGGPGPNNIGGEIADGLRDSVEPEPVDNVY
jgi:hypothetical protein